MEWKALDNDIEVLVRVTNKYVVPWKIAICVGSPYSILRSAPHLARGMNPNNNDPDFKLQASSVETKKRTSSANKPSDGHHSNEENDTFAIGHEACDVLSMKTKKGERCLHLTKN